MQNPSRLRDLIGPAAGAAIGLAIISLAFQIRDAGSGPYGPRFWPQLIGGLMLAINGWVVARGLLGRFEARDEPPDARPAPMDLRSVGARHGLTTLLVLGYPLIVHLMGFLVGSAIFLAAFMFGLGYRRVSIVMPTALVFSAGLAWFFTAGVFTPLPPGKGVFHAVSVEFASLVTGKR